MQTLPDQLESRNRPKIDVTKLPLHGVVDQAIALIREAGRVRYVSGIGAVFVVDAAATLTEHNTLAAELADFDVELSRVACWAAGDKLIWPPERVVAAVAAYFRRTAREALWRHIEENFEAMARERRAA